jgi:hypothetical protein
MILEQLMIINHYLLFLRKLSKNLIQFNDIIDINEKKQTDKLHHVFEIIVENY